MSNKRTFYSAKVVSTKDPDGLGRIKVSMNGYSEEPGKGHDGEWVRIAGPAAGSGIGMVWLPEDGQEVLVSPMGGPGEMIMTGSVYNGDEKPPYGNEDGKNNIKIMRTRSGNELIFSDEDGKERVEIRTAGKKIEIMFDNSGPTLTILCKEGDIAVQGTNVNVKAEHAVIQASMIELKN